jgi:acetyl esterase/lipase
LLPGNLQPLRLWVADPHNGVTNRPAILWVHGGGFATGVDAMFGLANGVGRAYAQRGYVGFSVEYRIDTTVIGTGASHPSLCQWVQDHPDPTSQLWLARRAECQRNILVAQDDVLAAVRWVRAHAAQYGVDPNKVAVGGFSAGAVTASNTAYQWDDVGTVTYFSGDDRSPEKSRPQAAFGASGCTYSGNGGAPTTIDAGDAPVSFIHSELDPAVPYSCAATTVLTARSKGLVAELTSYCGQAGHAEKLYEAHQAATDEQWTTFLARQLHIYTGMRPPSADPTC